MSSDQNKLIFFCRYRSPTGITPLRCCLIGTTVLVGLIIVCALIVVLVILSMYIFDTNYIDNTEYGS